MFRRRRSRFGRQPRATNPVIQSTGVQTKRRSKCKGCLQPIEVGDKFVRLRLRKRFKVACATCGAEPKGAKRFHEACVPTDINKAMGYDPNRPRPGVPPPPPPGAPRNGAVPPPPKPKSAEEHFEDALASLEVALASRLRKAGKKLEDPTFEGAADFRKYQGLKARMIRGSTPGEVQAARNVGFEKLAKLVKTVFDNN